MVRLVRRIPMHHAPPRWGLFMLTARPVFTALQPIMHTALGTEADRKSSIRTWSGNKRLRYSQDIQVLAANDRGERIQTQNLTLPA